MFVPQLVIASLAITLKMIFMCISKKSFSLRNTSQQTAAAGVQDLGIEYLLYQHSE